jgi:pyridoxine 5-phosphate synthase
MSNLEGSVRLGVNIDHVATLRQLRGTPYPDLIEAARLCERGGADQITVHLREDRRHIQDADVFALGWALRKSLSVKLNLEMAATPEMLAIARKLRPDWVCLVPEKRREVTTEGGLALKKNELRIRRVIDGAKHRGVRVSLFVEPSTEAMRLSARWGADAVEIHTGRYCTLTQKKASAAQARSVRAELARIEEAATLAHSIGIGVHAGHGFDHLNVRAVAALTGPEGGALVTEYNIGHWIVCRAAMVGLERAVREMKAQILAP